MKKPVNMTLTVEVKQKASDIARATGLSLSGFTELLLREAIKKEERKQKGK